MGNCNKVAYANEKLANEDIDRIQAKSVRDKKPVRSYLCNKCKLWHLTSSPNYKSLYQQAINELTEIKQNGYAKHLEINLHKLQLKLKEAEAKYNSERANDFNANNEIKTLNNTISKQAKEISRLKKDNADLINKNITLQNGIDKSKIS